MARRKQASKKARTKPAGEEAWRFKETKEPGRSYDGLVWHEPFSYKGKGGRKVSIRGHWERVAVHEVREDEADA